MIGVSTFFFIQCFVGILSFHLPKNAMLSRSTAFQMKVIDNIEIKIDSKVAKGLLAIFSGLSIFSSPVVAANYGGFGSSYSAVINPKDAVINSETAKSSEVQAGIDGLKAVTNVVKTLKDDIAKDNQIDIYSRVKGDFKISAIRDTLNKYNTAFDEDTQRASDRLIRNVLQDIIELQRESQVKPGKARSTAKVQAVTRRLNAAQESLEQLAAFYK